MPQGHRFDPGRPAGRASHLSLVPDGSQAGKASSVRLDADLLSVTLELAAQAIRDVPIERREYACLLALLYEGVSSGMAYDLLLDFARSRVAELRNEVDTPLPGSQDLDSDS